MNNKNTLTIGIIILAIVGVVAYSLSKNGVNPNPSVSPIVFASPTASSNPTFTPTPTPQTSATPTPSVDVSSWQEYNSNLTTTLLFKNLKAPFLFKYPKDWRLSEGLSGIQVFSFDDQRGYDIGTVPAGKFMIQILSDITNKDNEEIKSWCKNNLYDSPIKEFLSEKYIEVDGNKSYSVDYKIRSGNFDLIRQICITKPGLKIIIRAEPLEPNYLVIFDKILLSFEFNRP